MTIYVIYCTDGDIYEPWVFDLGYVMSEMEAIDITETLNKTIPQFSHSYYYYKEIKAYGQ